MDALYIDELQIYLKHDYVVNDNIILKQPTIGEIANFGEKKYYSMISTLTATPSDMISELDSIGVNFMEADEFQLFIMLTKSLTVDDTKLIFGDLDFSKFNMCEDTNINDIVLFNEETKQKIDRLAFLKITNYLRVLHGLKKNEDKAFNDDTRKIMIMLDKQKKSKSNDEEYHSMLKQLISAMMRYPGFNYKTTELCECGIYEFMDTVKGAQIYVSSTALLQGNYSGMIDTKSIKPEKFNWLRNPDEL